MVRKSDLQERVARAIAAVDGVHFEPEAFLDLALPQGRALQYWNRAGAAIAVIEAKPDPLPLLELGGFDLSEVAGMGDRWL